MPHMRNTGVATKTACSNPTKSVDKLAIGPTTSAWTNAKIANVVTLVSRTMLLV
jgi:hypothetical protein